MATGINSQWASFKAANYIGNYTSKVSANVTRLASNTKFATAADNPAGLAFTQRLRANTGGVEQVAENLQNSQALFKVADTAYSSAIDILTRIKELAAQASDPSLDDADAANAGTQVTTLLTQITNIKSTATYNGKTIFGGEFIFELGGDTSTPATAAITDMTAPTVTTFSSVAEAKTQLGAVTADIATLTGEQAALGGWESGLGYVSDFVNNKAAVYQEAESNAGDANVAKEMAAYVRNSVSLQAGQLILAQHNQNAYSVLNLLK